MMDELLKPSLYGFRNVKPRGRRERRAMNDKTATEKLRLEQRVGIEARLHRANAPEYTSGLTSCSASGAGYINNADRFHTDTAGEERELRHDMMARKQQIIENHRILSVMRDEDKQKFQDIKKQKDDEHMKWLQNKSSSVLKNASGASYDITNMEYLQSPSGIAQKHVDDLVRYRAQLRTRNLVLNADTRVSYNIINGDNRDAPQIPSQPNTLTSKDLRITPWSSWEDRQVNSNNANTNNSNNSRSSRNPY